MSTRRMIRLFVGLSVGIFFYKILFVLLHVSSEWKSFSVNNVSYFEDSNLAEYRKKSFERFIDALEERSSRDKFS